MKAQINYWPGPQDALEGSPCKDAPLSHFEARGRTIVSYTSQALVTTNQAKVRDYGPRS